MQLALLLVGSTAICASATEQQPEAILTNKTGVVTYQRPNYAEEALRAEVRTLNLYARDRIRTRESSTAVVWLNQKNCSVRLRELSTLEILPPVEDSSPWLNLVQGALYLFSRDRAREARIKTRHATGAPRGTEFAVIVEPERTLFAMYDGTATLTNDFGSVDLQRGDLGIAIAGQKPTKSRIEAENIVQWWLYYPGVLDVDELEFTPAERNLLAESLEAYRNGNLPAALSAYPGYPSPSEPVSNAGRIYLAGLLLSAGEVSKAEALLKNVPADSSPAAALRWVIAAVQQKVAKPPEVHTSASEWLGLSYYFQARHELDKALEAAQRSVALSTNFAFGWERLAELQFSFGRVREAKAALDRSLQLGPRNAQAHALKGFLLSAENRWSDARAAFDDAISLDSSLGNGWLGRGLVRIRKGDPEGGRADLQMAAILEPNRSLLHSYLGKAFSDAGADDFAAKELDYAQFLDPNDPTPWLYAALLKWDQNEINSAVTNLEKSIQLNTNRAVYRSQMLLDQDRAVRSANLAAIYRDAGMFEVSVREASRSVASDYANYSAHLFLANSYVQLSDPNLVSLRYETATFSEYLLANLLSPVSANTLSRNVSQQEYSKLFERDRLGFSSSTTYLSNGDWQQEASQFGNLGNTGWALDGVYRSFNGQRPNNDLEQSVFSMQFKQQLTAQDVLYAQTVFNDFESGDLRQYYDPRDASRTLRVDEEQEPNLFVGYHHEWSPGMHTLLLAGRLDDTLKLSEPNTTVSTRDQGSGEILDVGFAQTYGSEFDAYTAELQQIFQVSRHTAVAGARFQTGETRVKSELTPDPGFPLPIFDPNGYPQRTEADLERLSFYAYDNWAICDSFSFSAGLTYDRLQFPQNVNSPPISERERDKEQISPKAGLIWTPRNSTSVRGAYTRSLGGLFYDQSVRLEPTQVAGFNQAFRSLFPESLVGTVAGSEFETFSLGLDHRFTPRTYLVLESAILRASASQSVGFLNFDGISFAQPAQRREKLDYQEESLTVALNQLVGRRGSLGTRYRLSDSELETRSPGFSPATENRAVLHQASLYGIFNDPSGFFAEAEALWWKQSNRDDASGLRDDDFWQLNAFAGYRFPNRHGQLSIGVANILSQDYRLNPVSLYGELPRKRTLVVSFRFNF